MNSVGHLSRSLSSRAPIVPCSRRSAMRWKRVSARRRSDPGSRAWRPMDRSAVQRTVGDIPANCGGLRPRPLARRGPRGKRETSRACPGRQGARGHDREVVLEPGLLCHSTRRPKAARRSDRGRPPSGRATIFPRCDAAARESRTCAQRDAWRRTSFHYERRP